MTLRQLEIFEAIIETGRFTIAAQKLHVAQPSVSQQIQLLEEELGEQLFVRLKNRKFHVTEAGKILKEHSDVILRQCKVARMEISSLSKEPVGQIRIGIGGHQLTFMLPPALIAFHQRYPRVSVDLVNGTTPQLVDMLKANRLDLAVINFPIAPGDLRTHSLFTEELVFVIRRCDARPKQTHVDAREIAKWPLVLYDQGTSTRQRLDNFFRELGVTTTVLLELSSVEAMKRMVKAGLGATIIPSSSVLEELDARELVALRINGRPLTRSVGIAMPVLTRLPKVIDGMFLLIQERFREIKGLLDR